MKILSLGLDNSVLNKQSALASRVVEYGRLVDKYFIVVPDKNKQSINLPDNIEAFGSGGKNKLLQLFNVYKLSKKLIDKEKFDIITVQDQYYLALIGYLLKNKFKSGLEIQVHGFEKFAGLRKIIARFVLPKADAVRAVSQRVKKQLIEEFDVNENKITVVPIYSDTTLSLRDRVSGRSNLTYLNINHRLSRRPEHESPRNDIGDFIFLTVGRLVPVKNIGLQILAISEVVKKYPHTELWIIGDGSEKEKLKVESKKLGVEDNIKFLGYKDREELDKIYNQADCFVLTSDYEGWGLAVIEAAAHGLPIIMTDVGCAGEIIEGFKHAPANGVHANDYNNVSGIVIPVGDKDTLVKNMVRLIQDSDLRRRLGENARQAVKKLPSKEETMKLYLASWQKARSFKVGK